MLRCSWILHLHIWNFCCGFSQPLLYLAEDQNGSLFSSSVYLNLPYLPSEGFPFCFLPGQHYSQIPLSMVYSKLLWFKPAKLTLKYLKRTYRISHFLFKQSVAFMIIVSLWNQLPICEVKKWILIFPCIKNTKNIYDNVNNTMSKLEVLNYLYFTVLLKIDVCHFHILTKQNLNGEIMKFHTNSFKSKIQITTELMKVDKETLGYDIFLFWQSRNSSWTSFKDI